jgi:hypothetical protein
MKRFWPFPTLALIAALLLPLAAASPAAAGSAIIAANCSGDHAVIGDSYTLAAGQQLDSNLIVLGGQANIAAGATVNCKVVVLGGSLDLAGKVLQDVVVMGGDARLRGTSEIDGQLQSVGGSFTQDDGAQIKGGVSQGFNTTNNGDGSGRLPFDGQVPLLEVVIGFYRTVTRTIVGSLGLGLLALLVALIWPEQTARVRSAITNAPGQSGALGLLTVVAVPVLIVLATITVCLIPVSFMAMVLLTAALAFGWIALGMLVGERLVGALKLVSLSPAVAAGLGTALLSLVVTIISWAPCVGWVAPVILAAVGLGAVTLTRFGTQPYFPARAAVPPSQPALSA